MCILCHGEFNKPKGLSCFRTFYEKCLQGEINENFNQHMRTFVCPLYWKQWRPPSIYKDYPISEWAEHFPTIRF